MGDGAKDFLYRSIRELNAHSLGYLDQIITHCTQMAKHALRSTQTTAEFTLQRSLSASGEYVFLVTPELEKLAAEARKWAQEDFTHLSLGERTGEEERRDSRAVLFEGARSQAWAAAYRGARNAGKDPATAANLAEKDQEYLRLKNLTEGANAQAVRLRINNDEARGRIQELFGQAKSQSVTHAQTREQLEQFWAEVNK
jgi:hypothetical protein